MKQQKQDLPWIGYVRVSSDQQAQSGLSLEAQEAKVRGMAAAKGFALADVVIDAGESAKSLDRPGIQRVMETIRNREIAGVIIAKLDRLSRRIRDWAELLEMLNDAEVSLISTSETIDTSTPAGRVMLNVIMAFAQFEREQCCERTRDALQAKLRRGEHAGNIPYGYRKQRGKSVPDKTEKENIALMKRLREEGKTYREIAEHLNGLQLTTRRGSEWQLSRVERVLKNAETEVVV